MTTHKIKGWKYWKKFSGKIALTEDISIDILIEGSYSKAREVFPSKNSGPYAFRTLLRWCIVRLVGTSKNDISMAYNQVAVQDLKSKAMASHYFAPDTEFMSIGIE